MLLQDTYFETGYTNSENYTAMMFLGCGLVVIHDNATIEASDKAGYKLHTIAGRKVGFAIFTKQV